MNTEKPRLLISSGYVVALMILVFSVSDVVMRMLPLRGGDTAWRIGAVGTVSGNIATWLLALLMISLTAFFMEHRRVLRTVAVFCVIGAVVTMLVVPFFLLDVLQLRRAIRSDTLLPFDVTMLRATLAIICTSAALLWMGIGGWKSTAAPRRKADASPAAMVVKPSRMAARSR
jgi:hypothetical protein